MRYFFRKGSKNKSTRQGGSTIPLSEARVGERLVVCGHAGGSFLQRRLTDMGLNPGVEIEVLTHNGGPMVVACRGFRLALGRGMSKKVMVSRLGPS